MRLREPLAIPCLFSEECNIDDELLAQLIGDEAVVIEVLFYEISALYRYKDSTVISSGGATYLTNRPLSSILKDLCKLGGK